jgi:hypothetical protein
LFKLSCLGLYRILSSYSSVLYLENTVETNDTLHTPLFRNAFRNAFHPFFHMDLILGALSSQSLRCHVPLLAAKLATEELRPAPGHHELSTAND